MTRKRDKKRANLRDVARAAEVSVATVSRVLNTPDVVQKKTREKVEKVIAELGFHPSAAARAINSGRTKIIGALIPTLDSDIFAITIDAIESRLGDFGFSLVVATTGEDPDVEAARARELLDIGVEGLFFPGIHHSQELYDLLDRTKVPTIAISYFDATFAYPTIGYDNREAARLALDHLLDLGHRRIAVVHGPKDHNDRTRARVTGASTQRSGTELAFFETDLSVAGGAKAARDAMKQPTEFDAYLCTSDTQAFGAIFELQRAGIQVPNDVSVMGLHDLPSAQYVNPSLSTIELPVREMGTLAAESLARWVEKDVRPAPVCLPSQLRARASTARKEN
ncbi:LacI family transcriptional regulator [Shimia isoporae]|uniref:LacI family transcriptional regulator n=1 Tax=Shimia isoporae TaxID=647720 RepID=A0A4R1N584_9RHOB|nr:LacI family DNA-binding transcriptional regulator [Shimia isoporae]TCL01192.1 LacI family transcriptional regulator [Shimia isoporae]